MGNLFQDLRYTPAPTAQVAGVYADGDHHAGAGYRSDHGDLHAGACRAAEVASGYPARRAVSDRQQGPLLQLGRLYAVGRVLVCSTTSCITSFKDNTPAFEELAAFQGGSIGLGMRRAG